MSPKRCRPSVVIAGSLAQRARFGGHTWVLLQYLLGFRELGWDVLFLDRLDEGMAVDGIGRPCPVDRSVNWQYLVQVMRRCRLDHSFALMSDGGWRWLGLPRAEVIDRVQRSSMLINVMGFLNHPEVMAAAPVRVFLDIDPGFGQMWMELGLVDIFRGHDLFVTVGENIGSRQCPIPTAGLEWVATRPPVVLRYWPAVGSAGGSFTGIGSWRGPYDPVEYRGRSFGLRVHEFRKFVDLPKITDQRFRLALDIDSSDGRDLGLLASAGWSLQNPLDAVSDPWRYRRYVQESKAEFMVAKGMYVDSVSGWMSDRSTCFLASGKPVLAQDTGISEIYPVGQGLVTFRDLGEASEGVRMITSDYQAHARRARELAEEYFDSRKVLTSLIDRLGVR